PAAPAMPGVKAAPIPGIVLHANPHFRASIDGKLDMGARLGVVAATAYANTNASFGNDRLKITVSRKDVDMVGPPIHVRLIPRDRNGVALPQALLAVEGNSLDGFLAIDKASDGAQSVELTLNTRNLGPIVDDGFAEVSIDGFARAYWGTLNGKAAAAPFGVSVPQAAIPGKPIPVQLLAQSDDGPVSIVFDRTGGEQIKRLPTPRNEGVEVRIGTNGEAIFATRSEDWVVEFPTQGVFGKRDFFARTATKTSPRKTVKFDATPPGIELKVEPVKPMTSAIKMFRPGQKIRVSAIAIDAESDIDPTKPVVIFLGDRPGADGKPAPNSQVKLGQKVDGKDEFVAEFEIPATYAASTLKVGAIVFNGVGLPGVGEGIIKIDYTPPDVSVVRFYPEKPPIAGYRRGDLVRFMATAMDEESGIDLSQPVRFFLGDPPAVDGKPSQGTIYIQYADGILKDQKSSKGQPIWAADIRLPNEINKETELKMGVMFVNGVGMPGYRTGLIKLEFDGGHGAVKVHVTQGSGERDQPGVKVYLLSNNKPIAQGVTDDCGMFTFKKVPVGTYTAWAVKPADENSQAFKTINVEPDHTTDVPLSIIRQYVPPAQPAAAPPRR
ncbi:MAG TPA: hypothetical protein VGI99_11430, partial [Gemmataceae bacterium]